MKLFNRNLFNLKFDGFRLIYLIALLSVFTMISGQLQADPNKAFKQKNLDQRCEQARQDKLIPIRKKLIKECTSKKDVSACEAEFANYGERVGVKVPLYYDLPECEQAAAHLRSYRQGNK